MLLNIVTRGSLDMMGIWQSPYLNYYHLWLWLNDAMRKFAGTQGELKYCVG